MDRKACFVCKIEKDIECFHLRSSKTGKRRRDCIACRKEIRNNQKPTQPKPNPARRFPVTPLGQSAVKKVTVSFTNDEHALFKSEADKKKVSVSKYIRILLLAPRPGTQERLDLMAERFERRETLFQPKEDLHADEVVDDIYDEDEAYPFCKEDDTG